MRLSSAAPRSPASVELRGASEVMTDLDKLSKDALRVLSALLESSDGNGHDFGLTVDAFEALDLSVQAFAAHVGHLAHVFDWKEDLAADPGVQCSSVQFGLTAETIAAWPEVVRRIAEVMTDETETPKPSPIIDLPGGDAIHASELTGVSYMPETEGSPPRVVLRCCGGWPKDYRFHLAAEAFAERDRIITAWKAATS